MLSEENYSFTPLQVVNIFNLFITYGDTFLATTNSYDELYYELNREEKVFSEIHAMGMNSNEFLLKFSSKIFSISYFIQCCVTQRCPNATIKMM